LIKVTPQRKALVLDKRFFKNPHPVSVRKTGIFFCSKSPKNFNYS